MPVLGDAPTGALQPGGRPRIDGRALTASLRTAAAPAGSRSIAAGARGLDTSGDRATAADGRGHRGGRRGGGGRRGLDARRGRGLSVTLPVRPVKGQIVHLRVDDPAPGPRGVADRPAGARPLPRAVAGPPGGLRGDVRGPRGLRPATHRVRNPRAAARVPQAGPGTGRSRAGRGARRFRPFTPDDLPLLGPVPGWDNVHVDTGHGAEGLLAGPYSGALVAAWVLGDERSLTTAARRALEAFSPGRLPA